MAKRYLSLDEAALKLGLKKEELNRHREKGEIRGFADRGTFKFKEEDVEELGRRLQPSSDPDLQMFGDDDASVLDDSPANDEAPSFIQRLSNADHDDDDSGGSIFDDFGKGGSSDSDVRLVMDDRLNAQHDSDPDAMLQFGGSDSDVRLQTDSDSDVKINLNDSDSDVRLASDGPRGGGDSVLKMAFMDSDSDVRLDDSGIHSFAPPSDSDSDVRLSPESSIVKKNPKKPDSDSDVALVSDDDSDSDVHLSLDSSDDESLLGPQSDSDVQLVTDSDSDVRLLDESHISGLRSSLGKPDSDSDVAVLSQDSGVGLGRNGGGSKSGVHGQGSSVLLDDDISLGPASGISLTGESGVALTSQSGIALDRAADSGVSLEKQDIDSGLSLFDEEDEGGITLAEDSGIALQMDDDADSGIALGGDEDEGLTLSDAISDSGIALKDDDDDFDLTSTLPAMKIPKRGEEEDDDGMGDTMLEVPSFSAEQDESDFEIGAADGGSQGDTSVLLFDDEDETDDGGAAMVKKKGRDDDEEEESFEFNEGEDEEETAESEDIDGDVFAGDEAFEEDGEFDESSGDFATTPAKAAVAGAIEYPWGAGVVTTLMVSSAGMLLCGIASIDLIRSMWGWQAYSPANGWLIELLGGMFK